LAQEAGDTSGSEDEANLCLPPVPGRQIDGNERSKSGKRPCQQKVEPIEAAQTLLRGTGFARIEYR
jgi:hypothetical protein